MPTSSTYAANMAPPDKRGRYMGLYGLTWGVASGFGPVLGGALSDNLGPRSTWIGGSLVGFCAVAGLLFLWRRSREAVKPALDVRSA
jgi:MFS family permease